MDKVSVAIERIKEGAMMSEIYYRKPLLICYSGGKDSDVILEIAKLSGCSFEVQHSLTTADSPETVRYVKEKFKKLEQEGIKCSINYPIYKGKRTSMWELIPMFHMPPLKTARYCCSILKEGAGKNRVACTGVRWEESAKRRTRGIYESINRNKDKKIVLTNDNDERRNLIESCIRLNSHVVNPIIDWSNSDVWQFLSDMRVNCNPTYCWSSRVGCIGCPLASTRNRTSNFARYPKYRNLYLLAFDKMLKINKKNLYESKNYGNTAEEVFHWWIEDGVLPGQMDLFNDI